MNELKDELRDLMDSPPGFEPVQLDMGYVIAAGGRLRRRRRIAVAAVSGVSVATLLVGGGQLMNVAGGDTGIAPGSSGASASPMPSDGMPSGSMPSGVPSAINSSAPGILGYIVETGQRLDDWRWIIYVETVDPDHLNQNVMLVLGRTKTGYINDFTRDIVAMDSGQSRLSPGFHAVRQATVVNSRTTPTFGYYAGSPTRITARDSRTGKTVEAHLTSWTGFDPREKAQIFWFDFAQGQTPAALTGLTAYDKDGHKLPA